MTAFAPPRLIVAATAPATPATWIPVPDTESASSVCTPSPELSVRTSMPSAVALPAIEALRFTAWASTAMPAAMPTRFSTALPLAERGGVDVARSRAPSAARRSS